MCLRKLLHTPPEEHRGDADPPLGGLTLFVSRRVAKKNMQLVKREAAPSRSWPQAFWFEVLGSDLRDCAVTGGVEAVKRRDRRNDGTLGLWRPLASGGDVVGKLCESFLRLFLRQPDCETTRRPACIPSASLA
jgi:hypothetical protein